MNDSLPNPDTPLAFLPPVTAAQFEGFRYLNIATLGANIWDILIHSGQEYRMMRKSTLSIPTLAYYVSRIMGLAYVTVCAVMVVGLVPNCQAIQVALGWCYVAQLGASSGLFFLRAKAIFRGYNKVIAFYALLWVCNAGIAFSVPFAISGGHIANTMYCIATSIRSFSASTLIVSFVHDTLIVLGITWKFALATRTTQGPTSTLMGRIRHILGYGLPEFSKAVLQGGLQYYIVTVAGNIICMALILSPSVPTVLRAMFTNPASALEAAMACRVYREIKLGIIENDPTVVYSRSIRFRTPTLPTHRMGESGGKNEMLTTLSFATTTQPAIETFALTSMTTHLSDRGVHVQKEIKSTYDGESAEGGHSISRQDSGPSLGSGPIIKKASFLA